MLCYHIDSTLSTEERFGGFRSEGLRVKMLPYASKVQAGSYEKWLKVPSRTREPAALETPFKVSCLAEAIHRAIGAMCRKAFLDRSATEAHRERQYGNQHVLTRFERQLR